MYKNWKVGLVFSLCVFFCGNFISCASKWKTAYDVLSSKGFDSSRKQSSLFCSVRKGETVKNINTDGQKLLNELRKAVIVKRTAEPTEYTINFATGSSLPSQAIGVSVGKTGSGYVVYMNEKIAFFKDDGLYKICEELFNKSTIFIH